MLMIQEPEEEAVTASGYDALQEENMTGATN